VSEAVTRMKAVPVKGMPICSRAEALLLINRNSPPAGGTTSARIR
jgi:hypothetical protein